MQATQDRALAADLVEAEASARKTGNSEWLMDCENTVLDRLTVSLDETEQGLTRSAVEQIERFVSENIGRAWAYGG